MPWHRLLLLPLGAMPLCGRADEPLLLEAAVERALPSSPIFAVAASCSAAVCGIGMSGLFLSAAPSRDPLRTHRDLYRSTSL